MAKLTRRDWTLIWDEFDRITSESHINRPRCECCNHPQAGEYEDWEDQQELIERIVSQHIEDKYGGD